MNDVYAGVMWLMHFLCHQRPERSPHLWGVQLPLCWRCSGIALGVVVLICWLIVKRRVPAFGISVAMSLLLPLDVLLAVVGVWDGDNRVRFMTGILWGVFAVAAWLRLLQRCGDALTGTSPPVVHNVSLMSAD